MGSTSAVVLGLILGTIQWNQLAERSATHVPLIFETFPLRGVDPKFRDQNTQKQKQLGVYEASSIPMYYQYLLDNPRSFRLTTILIIVKRNPEFCSIFLRFASDGLTDKLTRATALGFITTFGTAKQAKAVAAVLLDPQFQKEDPRNLFACLERIGGRDEMAILTQYAVNQIASDKDQTWVENATSCRKVIETRLESSKRK